MSTVQLKTFVLMDLLYSIRCFH